MAPKRATPAPDPEPSDSEPSDDESSGSEPSDGETLGSSDTESEWMTDEDEDDEDDDDSLKDFIVDDDVIEYEEEGGDGSESGDGDSDAGDEETATDEDETDDEEDDSDEDYVPPNEVNLVITVPSFADMGREYRCGAHGARRGGRGRASSRSLQELVMGAVRNSRKLDCCDPQEAGIPISQPTERGERKRQRVKHYTSEENDFYKSMSPEEQQMIQDIEQSMAKCPGDHNERMPLRFKILRSPMGLDTKRLLLHKLEEIHQMGPLAGDVHKSRNWLTQAMRLPIGRYAQLPITSASDGQVIRDFLSATRSTLDTAVYGHRDSKEHILRIIAQWVSNPLSRGHCIGIQGPMGVGKTTLVKEGIAKALNLPFAFLALGGAADGAYLEGHSITYEASTPGKIAEVLMKAGVMNPLIFFDELDKVSETPKGEEIIGILTHLTDASQNEHFNDRYFSEIDIDLSKALIVFSFNDESKINPILKDRMNIIRVGGYSASEKLTIARQHLVPSLLTQYGLTNSMIEISDDILRIIIDRVPNESGVRNLKRGIESVVGWYNMLRFLPDPECPIDTVEGEPFVVTEAFVRKYLKKQGNGTEDILHTLYL